MNIRNCLALGTVWIWVLGCNDSTLIDGPPEPPSAPQPDVPEAIPTPEPCMFYGVDGVSNLWRIDPMAVEAILIGPTSVQGMTDIAISPDGTMVGITKVDVYGLVPTSGQATALKTDFFDSNQVAADALPDGRLLVGGDDTLAVSNWSTGEYNPVGYLPNGFRFSGDIAVRSHTKALATAQNEDTNQDHLFVFDLYAGSATDLGSLGWPRVFGLDFGCDGHLYGLVDDDPLRLLQVDPATGQNSSLGFLEGPDSLWGASGPADELP